MSLHPEKKLTKKRRKKGFCKSAASFLKPIIQQLLVVGILSLITTFSAIHEMPIAASDIPRPYATIAAGTASAMKPPPSTSASSPSLV